MALKKTFNPMHDLDVFNIKDVEKADAVVETENKILKMQESEINQKIEEPEIKEEIKLKPELEPSPVEPEKTESETMEEPEPEKTEPETMEEPESEKVDSETMKELESEKTESETMEEPESEEPETMEELESEKTESESGTEPVAEHDETPVANGTSISRLNKLFLKRTSLKNNSNMNDTMIAIIAEQYQVNPFFTDEELIAIEDEYAAVQKTNVKMLFMIPKYLKDFIDNKSMELGISRAALQNHFLNQKRENAAK